MKKRKLRLQPGIRVLGRLARFLLRSQILTIFFALCVLGVIVGAQTRPPRGAFPHAELFDGLRVVSFRESPSDTSARFIVQLSAGGKVFSQYDVDARRFERPTRGRPYARTITGTHYGPLRVRGHVAHGFWLDLPNASARRSLLPEQFDELYRTTIGFVKPVSLVTGALGVLSGYSVGYRLGTWNASLSSRAVQERVLATPDLGRTIAREAWRRVLLEPVVMTGEDDAARFAAVAGTHRLYANFFRLALEDSNGFIPREAERLARLGRPNESRAMLAYAAAVRRAALDSVHLASADFDAVERWASLLDRRGHWVQGAIPPPGEERIQLLGTLAWYGLAPPSGEADRVWVGPRLLVRDGDTEGFVTDEIPATGVGCPTAWGPRLNEDKVGTSAMASAWLADRPEFSALAVLGRRAASGLAAAARRIEIRRPGGRGESPRLARDPRAAVPAAYPGAAPAPAIAGAVANAPPRRRFERAFPGIAGEARLVLIAADSAGTAALARAAQATAARVESLMGGGNPSSEVERLNREAGRGPAPVHPEIAHVIAGALRAWRESARAFDPTAGPLARAWGLDSGPRRVPPEHEIEAALRHVGAQQVAFDSTARTLGFLRDSVRLDLGGLAGGYAVDAMADTLRARGVRDALLECSGDAIALGSAADRGPWAVAIPDPRDRAARLGRVSLAPGQAISVSGRYEPFVLADGREYGPAVDPRTGRSAEGLIAVATLAPDALTAEAWRAALFVLGPAEARRLARERADLSVVLIEPGAAGTDVIWVETDLRDRFALDPQAQARYRVEYF